MMSIFTGRGRRRDRPAWIMLFIGCLFYYIGLAELIASDLDYVVVRYWVSGRLSGNLNITPYVYGLTAAICGFTVILAFFRHFAACAARRDLETNFVIAFKVLLFLFVVFAPVHLVAYMDEYLIAKRIALSVLAGALAVLSLRIHLMLKAKCSTPDAGFPSGGE